MMFRTRERLTLIGLALTVATCAGTSVFASKHQTGFIAAHWTAKGKGSIPVTISWESEDDLHGRMHSTLGPGGERFEGRYVRVTERTPLTVVEPILTGWGPIWEGYAVGSLRDPWWWGSDIAAPGAYGAAYYSGFLESYTGKVVATLTGNRGHTMRCRFTLAHAEQGLLGGGKGGCQSGVGGSIVAEF
jgi:hypothetical protein